MNTTPSRAVPNGRALGARAADVLRRNDTGAVVTAAPRLYPHMWSWDAAFIAVGLAHLDVRRAVRELETLFAAQWRDGMLPHIVFTDAPDYFPGPDWWGSEISPDAPRHPRSSGICQPPVHAVALLRIVQIAAARGGAAEDAAAEFAGRVWPRMYAWHRWLAERRDPDGTGLLGIVHSWESGMDNSPRWDAPYRAVHPGRDLPGYARRDIGLVGDAAQRPRDEDYDRYLWLVEEMRRVRYDPARVYRTSSFLVADVFATAVFALACEALADLGERLGQPATRLDRLRRWAERSRAAVTASRDPETGLARDRDLRADRWLAEPTIAGFAPLLCGGLAAEDERRLLALLDGPDWSGHPGFAAPAPPSTSPRGTVFEPRRYWRGPQWPVVVWLLGWALHRRGRNGPAARLRTAGLRLAGDGAFGEYYQPYTGEPLGSRDQSWTAAVVLDWLAEPDPGPPAG
jgi:glucosylglycerate hydrolase